MLITSSISSCSINILVEVGGYKMEGVGDEGIDIQVGTASSTIPEEVVTFGMH